MTKRLLILCFAVFMISSAIAQEASRWRGPTADGKYPDTGVMKQWPQMVRKCFGVLKIWDKVTQLLLFIMEKSMFLAPLNQQASFMFLT